MKLVWDVEADNFYPMVKKTWVIVIKSLCGTIDEKIYPFRNSDAGNKFMELIQNGDTLIGHNILGYDFFVIMKTMGVKLDIVSSTLTLDNLMSKNIEIIDTLCLSRFVNPDSEKHGLEHYGKKLGFNKIDFHEFDRFSEEMVTYCDRDVNLNILVYNHLMRAYKKLYDTEAVTRPFWNYQVDHYLMAAQGFTGVLFDRERAKQVKASIAIDLEVIRAEIEPQLPRRAMNKGEEKLYTMPKKPYLKTGEPASSTEKWIEKMISLGHQCELKHENDEYTIILDGDRFPLKSEFIVPLTVPMTLSNQAQLKEWFMDIGWKPTFWNFKKDSNAKFIRTDRGQLIPTSPKLQEQGKLCPNLDLIDVDIAKDVVKWLSLRNRHSVIGNWIDNPRLDRDGRLSSSSTGTTPTYRHKHTEVVNVPKAQVGVLYGKEFRSLFIVPEGRKMVGADAAGLEARVDGHYCAKTDNGERANIILNGDIHSRNAKLFFPEETAGFDIDAPDFDKEHPDFKPYRSRSKNAAYALAYGCGVKKLAETLGKPNDQAQELYDAFWDGNPALKAVKQACAAYWSKHNKKFLLGIDGRFVFTRKESALVNSLFQSCGAIIMSYAGEYMNEWLGGLKFDDEWLPYYEYNGYICKRVLFMHDEFQYECDEEIAEEIGQMVVDAIIKAGVDLNMRLELGGDFAMGDNWAETH